MLVDGTESQDGGSHSWLFSSWRKEMVTTYRGAVQRA